MYMPLPQQSPCHPGWGWRRMRGHENSISLWPEAGKTPSQRQVVLPVPWGRQALCLLVIPLITLSHIFTYHHFQGIHGEIKA